MKAMEKMSVAELETLREQVQASIEELKAQFVRAGKLLEQKRQAAEVEAKLAEAQAEVVRLQALQLDAEA